MAGGTDGNMSGATAANAASNASADGTRQHSQGDPPQTNEKNNENQPQNLGTINIKGIHQSLSASLATKRTSNAVVGAITAEDIGKFPATNVAEALSQIPGVTLDRNMPAQQRVSIDGISPNLNLTLLDGHPVSQAFWLFGASPQRGFDFSLLPAQIVGKLEVYKTSEAKLPAGGLAGTILVHTVKPLDVAPNTVAGSVGYNYNEMASDGRPSISLFYGTHDDSGTFGFDVVAQHYEQVINRQGFETLGYYHVSDILATGNNPAIQKEVDEGKLTPDTMFPRAMNAANFMQKEKRDFILVNLQAKPSDVFQTTVQLMYEHDDLSNVNQSIYPYITHNMAGIAHLGDVVNGVATSGRSVHATPCKHDLQGTCAAGADSYTDEFARTGIIKTEGIDWRTQYDAQSWGFSTRLGISDTQGDVGQTLKEPYYSGGYSWTIDKGVVYDAPKKAKDPDYWTDAGWGGNHPTLPHSSRDTYGQVDFSFDTMSSFNKLLFGVRYHDHHTSQKGFNQGTLGGPQTFREMGYGGITDLSGIDDLGYSDFEVHHPHLSGADAITQEWRKNGLTDPVAAYYYGNTFKVQQQNEAAYFQADFSNYKDLRGNIGVRVVRTQIDSYGWRMPARCNSQPIGACNVPEGYGFIDQSSSDTRALPSFNIAWTVAKNLVLRGALSKTIAYAPYKQYAPYFASNDTALTASSGNPDLSPYQSNNATISAEWYFQPDAVVAATLFYKDVDNYITQKHIKEQQFNASWNQPGFKENTGQTLVNEGLCTPDGMCQYDVAKYVDGGSAKVKGIALSYQQAFKGGFGLKAGYTYSDASTGATGNGKLPYNSQNSYTIKPYYESGPFSVSVAFSHRGPYLASGYVAGAIPVEEGGYNELDASIGWQLTDHLALSLNGLNLLNDTYEEHVAGNETAITNRYKTGRQFLLRLRFKF
jgi:iron complex outermembrane receptor protein